MTSQAEQIAAGREYQWVSRNGSLEARLFNESAEEVLFFFRHIGTHGRGVAKAMSKEGFRQHYKLKPITQGESK